MAKPKKAKAANPKATKPKPMTVKTAAKKPAKGAAKKPTPKKRAAAKSRKAAPRRPEFQRKATTFNIADLIDHPLVADLLAVGAMAAVGAIADHNVKKRTGEAEAGSSRAIKAAGKAAAAAVGKRLMTEVDAIKQASKPKDPKRGSK
jgi:hypothetical protein